MRDGGDGGWWRSGGGGRGPPENDYSLCLSMSFLFLFSLGGQNVGEWGAPLWQQEPAWMGGHAKDQLSLRSSGMRQDNT